MKNKLIVKELLDKFGLLSAPINIESLAEKLGIQVIEKSLEDSTSGLLITSGDTNYIVINKSHHPNRKRFSIAHEIAHFILHRNSADVFVDNFAAFFRDGDSSTGEYRKEVQANRLAAELLMPEEILSERINNSYLDLHDDEIIQQLAKDFEVSSVAMAHKLENLNLLHRTF